MAQRGILWRESRLERVRKCGWAPVGADGLVAIKVHDAVAHYTGLQTCGSVWACPVCQPKILNTRSTEISQAASNWDKLGNSVYMVTFTAPHDRGMKLAKLMPVIANGFRKAVLNGRPWIKVRDQAKVRGTIRSIEVTHGANGWHPHIHALVFIEGDPGALALANLVMHMRQKWAGFITKAGLRAPSLEHGVKIVRCYSAAEAGAYLAKTDDGHSVGNELARGDLKSGRAGSRTPLEILESFRQTGDLEDLVLWGEYETATKGRQRITWSKGLRKLLLSVEEERTDEEIAADEVGGDTVAVLEQSAWKIVRTIPGLPGYLLDQAEKSGRDGVLLALATYGLDLVPDP
jgi:hypothetical protein